MSLIIDDHGNSEGDATAIRVGADVRGELEYDGDFDFFRFQAEAGWSYQINVALGTLDDSIVELYAADGSFLDANDDYGNTYASRLSWRASSSGERYVFVGGYGIGTYTLTVSVIDDHGNDFASATRIAIGEAVAVELEHLDDMDVLVFLARPGTDYVVTLDWETYQIWDNPGSIMALYDAGGQELARLNNYDFSSNRSRNKIMWQAATGGDYYIAIGDENTLGNFALTVTEGEATEPEATPEPTPTPVPTPDPRITQMFLVADAERPSKMEGYTLSSSHRIERVRLRVGEELRLLVRVRCEDGTLYWAENTAEGPNPCFAGTDAVTWVSSDEDVATVTLGYADDPWATGDTMRAVGTGTASMTAYFNGHATSLNLDVVSGVDIAERANEDRPDDKDGKQIHFVYAVQVGDESSEYDRDGDIALIATWMQEWLRERAGMIWRFDTHNGELDVSFLPIRFVSEGLLGSAEESGGIIAQFTDALEAREGGQLDPPKKYAVFFHYDGSEGVFGPGGVASSQIAVTLIPGPFHEDIASTAIHELLHTFGAVPACAPHATPGSHVTDSRLDIMGGGQYVDGVLDWGNDDYFRHDNAGCLDIEDSPYWIRE